MANMSYCRFQNTVDDLMECADEIHNITDLSDDEKRARKKLIRMCKEIASDFEDRDQ